MLKTSLEFQILKFSWNSGLDWGVCCGGFSEAREVVPTVRAKGTDDLHWGRRGLGHRAVPVCRDQEGPHADSAPAGPKQHTDLLVLHLVETTY